MNPYYTIVVPYVAPEFATEWHPTQPGDEIPGAPFHVLTRGAFSTEREAILWAQDKLNGTPYSIRYIPADEGTDDEWSALADRITSAR